MFLVSAIAAAALLTSPPPRRAAEVRDTLGVNIHIEYTDGGYRDLGRVLAGLQYLGVRHVRDAAPNPRNQGQAGYAALAKAGVQFDLFINGEPIAPALKRLTELERTVPGAVVSIEGPNEVNNLAGFNFEGEHNPHKAATLYQASLYAQVKASPTLSSSPVLAFTDYPYTFGRSDVQNEHPYQPGDRAPGAGLKAVVAAAALRAPGTPIVFTETGYSTSRAGGDVSERAQARLTMESLLEAAALGVTRTYLYELLDAYPDPAGGDHEKHFGLFDINYSPKPVARALRLMFWVLNDEAADARTFKPRRSAIMITGDAPDLRRLTLQKANGEEVVALWRDAAVFSSAMHSDVELAPLSVDLRLPRTHGAVRIIDAVAEKEGRLGPSSDLVRVTLGSDPILIQVAAPDSK